jgi:hypothetical protein
MTRQVWWTVPQAGQQRSFLGDPVCMVLSQHCIQRRRRLAVRSVAMPTGASERAIQSIVLLFDCSKSKEFWLIASGVVNVCYGGHVSENAVSIRTWPHLMAPSAA